MVDKFKYVCRARIVRSIAFKCNTISVRFYEWKEGIWKFLDKLSVAASLMERSFWRRCHYWESGTGVDSLGRIRKALCAEIWRMEVEVKRAWSQTSRLGHSGETKRSRVFKNSVDSATRARGFRCPSTSITAYTDQSKIVCWPRVRCPTHRSSCLLANIPFLVMSASIENVGFEHFNAHWTPPHGLKQLAPQ